MAQGDGTAVQVNLLIHLVEHFQIFQHWQGLCSEGFVELNEVDIGHAQTCALQCFLCRRYRTIAHDCRVHTCNSHRTNDGQRLKTQVFCTLSGHHDHARSTISDLRRRTRRHGAAFRVERRFQRRQTFHRRFRTNGLIVIEGFQEAVLIVALHRDDFVFELAFNRRLVGELMRTNTESVLLLASDAMHFAQHFCGQTHHARGFGSVQRHVRVWVNAMHHAHVTHMLDAADHENVTVTGHDRLRCRVQGAHRGAAQAAHGLRGRGVRDLGHQRRHARDVPALLQGLVNAAPDHVFHFARINLAVALQHFADQVRIIANARTFVGMHFFNPVHMMPLVEVMRGEKSSDLAVATTVAYAKKMGKNPIVVNDCPGFLVNRVLFPYFGGFAKLVSAGVDFVRIDKVMEKFGWPMGPAYLMDVVGIDTGHHGRDVMAEGFPDRMKDDRRSAIDALYEAKRLGQKNGKGFYAYEEDKRGKQKKVVDSSVLEVLKPIVYEQRDVTDEDIINWMMIPLCLETVRCLEDGIVETAAEADMGLVYGIGFPLFRGGALRYIDSIGVAQFVALADQYAELGALYHPTAKLREMAKNGQSFFG